MPLAAPGAAPYPAELQERLHQALAAKGASYEPRTHHKLEDGSPVYVNRLMFEDSPYLIQHAHNPVDWYPWGDEAFARAREEDKPIFLSIGYSTCHWCHVMERESFESVDIARILNENFVCVKVDRERRPDVDDLYMTAVQLLTNSGGWPMSSWLTPDGKPFYGGTYYPPAQFADLLRQIDVAWDQRRAELETQAENLARAVTEVTGARGRAEQLSLEAFSRATAQVLARHDPSLGGFGAAPKFPQEPWLLYLLDQIRRGESKSLGAVVQSLDAMARGGIYDQVGGGFHRYSVDAEWLVPHFEKMLYNQAHLARAYLQAYELTGNAFFGRVGQQILDYVLREMTARGGGFYSATDADSEGEEGLFFLWTPEELNEVLGKEDAAFVAELYGVRPGGNFEGQTIANLPVGFEDFANAKQLTVEAVWQRLDPLREKLWQAREKRIHPIRDDKVVTSWNGMMITAFAEGSRILGEKRYLDAARTAADFLWEKNHRGDGDLWRVHLDGSSSIEAVQDDYAYYAEALLAIHAETHENESLERAAKITDRMIERFWDAADGGFFMSAEGVDKHLIARPKSPTDGAIPSGNSVAVRTLAQLWQRTGENRFEKHANESLNAFGAFLENQPSGFTYMLMGAAELLQGSAGSSAWGAEGRVAGSVELENGGNGELKLRLDLKIREGWHINAHETLQEDLIPTILEIPESRESLEIAPWTLTDVSYPEAKEVELSFQDTPLAVYEGSVSFEARLRARADRTKGNAVIVPLALKIQACDDERCLRPEEMRFVIPAGALIAD